MKYSKTLVFGDIGGHFNEFERGLNSYGVSLLDLHIPKDFKIIQVGDLVHKGPDSDKLVSTVDAMTQKYGDQWIQLAGNHELPYISSQRRFYADRISEDSHRRLINMKYDGRLLKAHSIKDSENEDYLITHAGLTYHNYQSLAKNKILSNSRQIAKRLNNSEWDDLIKAGVILGRPLSYRAGIFWAECVFEVYDSWRREDKVANFNQIHGHSSVYNWSKGKIRRNDYPEWLTNSLTKDFTRRYTIFDLTESSKKKSMDFYAIDYGLNRKSFVKEIHPLVIE